MRKNIRKTPLSIQSKLEVFDTDYVSVSVPIRVKQSELSNYPNLGLTIANGKLNIPKSIMPDRTSGRFGKKNIDGYKGKPRKDLPKVEKEFYLGERYPFGNTYATTFSLYATREVWERDIFPPKEWGLVVELLDTKTETEEVEYTIKVGVDKILDRKSPDFAENLFFALNLLLENAGCFDVYVSCASKDDYIKTTYVEWEIFPAGSREDLIRQIVGRSRKNDNTMESLISSRIDVLDQMSPKEYIYGTYLHNHYFGAKFSNNVIAFENAQYGNAIYILFEDWEELSKLPRTEIMKLPPRKFIRIPHREGWERELRTAITQI